MDNSPIGKLPAEIRNRIYEFALTQENGIKLHWDNEVVSDEKAFYVAPKELRTSDGALALGPRQPRRLLVLTETCNQLRAESLPIFWSCNRFTCRLPYDWTNNFRDGGYVNAASIKRGIAVLRAWLSSFNANTAVLKRLTVELGPTYKYMVMIKGREPLPILGPLRDLSADFNLEVDPIIVLWAPDPDDDGSRVSISFKNFSRENVTAQVHDSKASFISWYKCLGGDRFSTEEAFSPAEAALEAFAQALEDGERDTSS